MIERRDPRYSFSMGQRPLVQYRLVSGSHNKQLMPRTLDAALIDLSKNGAKLLGELPYSSLFDLGNGFTKLACNMHLNSMIVKVMATIRWFKSVDNDECQFGMSLHLTTCNASEIQRFLIRHQIDTRRFARSVVGVR